LLDTHALLWAAIDHRRLGQTARRRIDSSDQVWASAVCIWEFGIKTARRPKLHFGLTPSRLADHAQRSGYRALDVSFAHALAASELPPHHHDPFDRMLVAQAKEEGLILVTADEVFASYGVRTLAADH
jgi:PIN domain nuclease of toxin-antitoxin system